MTLIGRAPEALAPLRLCPGNESDPGMVLAEGLSLTGSADCLECRRDKGTRSCQSVTPTDVGHSQQQSEDFHGKFQK
ncbi:hypothetical protein GHT09_012793 [Marmota monax]|uniref:Uncharacterized protein n=1 Tax=Marmota monax TaxID=9995 RepID=A0A834UZL1_MARMO|nr:hypothetical protein GHT09_012793 [Marmota monax]